MPALCASLTPPSLRMEWSNLEVTNGGQEMTVRWNVCTGHVNDFADKTWLTCNNFVYHTRKPQPQLQPQQLQPHPSSATSGAPKSTPPPDPTAMGPSQFTPDSHHFDGSPIVSHDAPPAVQSTTIRMDTVEVGLTPPPLLPYNPPPLSSFLNCLPPSSFLNCPPPSFSLPYSLPPP